MTTVPIWQTMCRESRTQAQNDCKALNGTLETEPTIAVPPKPLGMPLAVPPISHPPNITTSHPPNFVPPTWNRPGKPRINIYTPVHPPRVTHPPRVSHPPRINVYRPVHPPRINVHPQRTRHGGPSRRRH